MIKKKPSVKKTAAKKPADKSRPVWTGYVVFDAKRFVAVEFDINQTRLWLDGISEPIRFDGDQRRNIVHLVFGSDRDHGSSFEPADHGSCDSYER